MSATYAVNVSNICCECVLLLQHTWGLFMALLQRCVLGPLAAHMSAEPSGAAAQQQALRPEPAPGEETVVAMLERCAEKLHWSVRLCIARWVAPGDKGFPVWPASFVPPAGMCITCTAYLGQEVTHAPPVQHSASNRQQLRYVQ